MGLVKRTYVDQETVITAENLNAIQDAIIENEEAIEDQGEAIEGKYAKPSGGIPASDMASGVQTSLGKADSAYQKPSGGIPASDMASGVQTSLGKADTALQSSDIDNTLSVTGKAADAKKTGDEISDVRNTLNSLETDVGYLKSDIGIVEDTDTAQHTISAGQYVIWKGQLYTANAAIPSGTTLSGTNLTAVSGGGFNALRIVSGTESTGNWVKFPDGTLVQYGSFSVALAANTYTEYSLRYPIDFISYPSVQLMPQLWSDPAVYSWILRSPGSSEPLFRLGNAGNQQTVTWLYFAIGRWK